MKFLPIVLAVISTLASSPQAETGDGDPPSKILRLGTKTKRMLEIPIPFSDDPFPAASPTLPPYDKGHCLLAGDDLNTCDDDHNNKPFCCRSSNAEGSDLKCQNEQSVASCQVGVWVTVLYNPWNLLKIKLILPCYFSNLITHSASPNVCTAEISGQPSPLDPCEENELCCITLTGSGGKHMYHSLYPTSFFPRWITNSTVVPYQPSIQPRMY